MKQGEEFLNVDAYIKSFPDSTQHLLRQMRNVIKQAAPGAEEVISYGMPAYKYYGPLVYFGAYAKHIGFYPTGSGIQQFTSHFESYKSSKGAVQFPLDKPLPVDLITAIVKFRVQENELKSSGKKK